MRMSALVENVSKKAIPPWTKNLIVEVIASNEDDEDVEVRSKPILKYVR
jgi:ubiquitin-activating enzyme E1